MSLPHTPQSHSVLTTAWREERLAVDPSTNAHHARCRADETVSTAVVLTAATLHGCAPTALPPLAAAVDPDALARLVTHDATAETATRFAYAGCTVTVQSNGDITVTPDRQG
jgi:hypothetical protein